MECHLIFVMRWREENEKEKRSDLQIYILPSIGCNTDYNKLGERMREEG